METTINVALLLLAATSGYLAFGKTIDENVSGDWFKRVTKRGWLALGCIVLTLGLGVVKEALSQLASIKAEARYQQAEKDLKNTVALLENTNNGLKTANESLDEAKNNNRELLAEISQLRNDAIQMQAQLSDEKKAAKALEDTTHGRARKVIHDLAESGQLNDPNKSILQRIKSAPVSDEDRRLIDLYGPERSVQRAMESGAK